MSAYENKYPRHFMWIILIIIGHFIRTSGFTWIGGKVRIPTLMSAQKDDWQRTGTWDTFLMNIRGDVDEDGPYVTTFKVLADTRRVAGVLKVSKLESPVYWQEKFSIRLWEPRNGRTNGKLFDWHWEIV